MSQVSLWLLLFITLSFPTCEANSQGHHEDNKEKSKSESVSDLIKQTGCQPRETLVKVHEEFPQELQYTIMPRCVPVKRCSGCCTDEATMCIPEESKTVEFRVLRIYSDKPKEPIVLPFVMHTSCNCSPRRKRLH
ncbi:hypothetical protein KOW79_015761 [Hemibagrus wyckioides]|uniref:Platelet-derived growth factor (PDGF) family profile domain-containing protein n=1 Tax=Hemibagrus wyckioides TaxID=337641 RepID=A0A9D3NEQ3_9TELE|nr:snake venom vascular endothelial growth factor toxin [Hemibagrus wyckioides]KAG7321346.1 hypothetical protein KOW79_015761 [Hemibagrus wyckioides]